MTKRTFWRDDLRGGGDFAEPRRVRQGETGRLGPSVCGLLVLALALVPALVLFGAAPGGAQKSRQLVEEMPGFVDLGRFGSFERGDLKVEINLGGSLLKLLSGALEDEDTDFAKLLASLQLIRVHVFEPPGDGKLAAKSMDGAVEALRRQGWEAIVRIRNDEELNILIRSDGDLIHGLLATWAEPGGSVGMINIVGDFDPAQIARLARQLDIAPLEGLDLGASRKP